MGGDRRRTTNSIEVPLSLTPQHNSRKRPPSFSHNGDKTDMDESFLQDSERDEMDEANAARILMNLSIQSPSNAEKWLSSSPGSSSASWSSGSSSPPLSDDGHALNSSAILNDTSARIRTTSVSTSDEGIVVDFKEETPRKKKASKKYKCTWKGCKLIEHTPAKIERHIRNAHLGNKKARRSADYDGSCSENDHEEEFYYTEIEDDDDEGKTPSPTSPPTLSHFDMARPAHEDPDYQRQFVGNFKQGRVSQLQHHSQHHSGKTIYTSYMPTSNNSQQQQQSPHMQQSNCLSTSPLAHHNYTWPPSTANAASVTVAPTTPPQSHSAHGLPQQQQYSPVSHIRQPRSSPRPSQAAAAYLSQSYTHHNQQQPHQQHHNYSSTHAGSNNCHSNSSSSSSNSSTPIVHGNSNANNMLQQLSQQNITVTAHHCGTSSSVNHSPQQQQHQVPAVTITPNYHSHQNHQQQQQQQQQQHTQQQQHNSHSAQQQQQQSQSQSQHIRGHHHQAPHSQTTASNMVAIQHSTASTHLHQQHPQHAAVQHAVATGTKHTPNSPNRRTRGENKKCRKVYGMDRRDQWCTQCRWKKACTRFGD